MSKKEKAIEEIIDSLNKLVEDYQKALDVSNNLINMKNRFIELCEEETEIYKRECKKLRTSLIILVAVLALSTLMHLTYLFLI
jgi:tetrahydromethanopterin S-methyltransferase subunit B